jgi:flagellar biogenesis protein FliO
MLARFYKQLAPPQISLSGLAATAQFLIRWVSMSKRSSEKPVLQILERVSLTPHTSLALVRFEEETLVLGVTPQNVSVLARSANASGNTQSVGN